MLVGAVQPTGRAAGPNPGTGAGAGSGPGVGAGPCPFAAWPLVDWDGTVYACTRQSLARSARPRHLVLGHASRDSWRALRERTLGDPLLRSVRTLGPLLTRDRFAAKADGPAADCGTDACTACLGLSDGDTAARAADYLDSPGGRRTQAAVRHLLTARPAPELAAGRGAAARFAHLTELGLGGRT